MGFYQGKLVLVTGGSSGIGLALGKGLAQQGANVWIMARNSDRLEKAIKAIQALRVDPDQKFGCLQTDIRDYTQVEKAVQILENEAGVPNILINSAGIAHPGYFEKLDVDIFHQQMNTNYMGTVHVTRCIIPGMLNRGSGRVVFLSSVAGFLGLFGYSAYGPSKYAVRGLSDCLRAELKPRGIKFSIVYPPDTDTPQLAYENQFKPVETALVDGNSKVMSAEAVASAILKGIARGQYTILPGFEGNVLYRLTGGLLGNASSLIIDGLVASAVKKVGHNQNAIQH